MRYAIEIANRKPSACSNCQMRNAQKIRWFPRGFWWFFRRYIAQNLLSAPSVQWAMYRLRGFMSFPGGFISFHDGFISFHELVITR